MYGLRAHDRLLIYDVFSDLLNVEIVGLDVRPSTSLLEVKRVQSMQTSDQVETDHLQCRRLESTSSQCRLHRGTRPGPLELFDSKCTFINI